MKTYIRADTSPWRTKVDLFIVSEDRKTRVKEVILEQFDETVCAPTDPSFSLSTDAAQVLMDDLWNVGIRPTEGAGSAGAMRAVERHLEDMRALVFKTKAK